MDPRHPELALTRIKELIKQYDSIEERIRTATTSSDLSQAEREGGLVVQEICLVAPRLHESMIQASRKHRYDLTHGFYPEVSAEALSQPTKETIETYVAPNQAETIIVEPKPRKKKKTTKKKTADKKVEDGSGDN